MAPRPSKPVAPQAFSGLSPARPNPSFNSDAASASHFHHRNAPHRQRRLTPFVRLHSNPRPPLKRLLNSFAIWALIGSSGSLFSQTLPKPPAPLTKQANSQISLKLVERKLARVKTGEPDQFGNISDPNYLWLYGNRSNNLRSIMQAVQSTKRMPFPYSIPTPPNFTVGDLAFYLLCDWGYVDFEQVVSSLVGRESFRSNGYFAYFKWVQIPGNRSTLMKMLQEKIPTSDQQPNHALNSDAASA